jgi:hypothetical protein
MRRPCSKSTPLEADAKWNEIAAAASRPQKQKNLGIPALQLIQGFISRSAAVSDDGESAIGRPDDRPGAI